MSTHKNVIFATFFIFIVASLGINYLVNLGASFEAKPAWIELDINLLLAIWGSDLIVFVIEVLNYQDSKKSLMFDFIFEGGRIIKKYKSLRYCLRENREDYVTLRKVYAEICDIDIFQFYILHNSFNFICPKSSYSPCIDRISAQITKFYETVESKADHILFNKNEQFVNHQIIDSLTKQFEKEEQLGKGTERLFDIIESIETDLLKLQEDFFKVKRLPRIEK